MRWRTDDIAAQLRDGWDRLLPVARRGWDSARRGLEFGWRGACTAADRSRTRMVRMTLGTRLLLVLVSVAATSTAISVLLQDSALSADLQTAARARLERAAEMASQLLDDRVLAQLDRYRAVSSTPQFLANVEARHQPTLSHFAKELRALHDAEAILFMDRDGNEIAGAGDAALRAMAWSLLASRKPDGVASAEPGARSASSLFTHDGVPLSLVSVPLHDESHNVGGLVSLEAVRPSEMTAWSSLCRARVSIGTPAAGNELVLPVRPVGSLQLTVATSFEAERDALAHSRNNLLTGGLLGLALASMASIFLARSLVRPIRAIQAAAERIGEGNLQIRLDDSRSDEVGDVARAFNLMLDNLERTVRERTRFESQISHLAYHDSLTGLGNRRLLKERLGLALEQSDADQTRVAVIFLDLDRFKDVNDTLGHTAGDALLMEVARRLNSCVQTIGFSDPDRQDDPVLLVRLGGDEFTLLLTDVDGREEVAGLADRILLALASPFELRGQEVTLSASLGIALSPDDGRDVETLLRDSDMAMFHAKSRGGRGYEFYADSMEEIAAKRLALENRLRRALENGEFQLYYQPKVDLESNLVTGVEALLRWKTPDRGMIGPEEFVPMAEETGAIIPIGEWVLRTAIEQALEWQAEGLPPLRIAVNVSVRQIEHRDDFVAKVAAILEETGFDPRLLDLEITEGSLLKDEEAAIALFVRLRDMGVGLSLDDFGTGYSSLSYLRRLPIDTLKIDRSFIQGADSNPEDAALVGSIIAMAKVLDLRVVVEGVETRRQRRFLEDLGCDEIQGFLFSEPINAAKAGAFLRRKSRRNRRRRMAKARSASRPAPTT